MQGSPRAAPSIRDQRGSGGEEALLHSTLLQTVLTPSPRENPKHGQDPDWKEAGACGSKICKPSGPADGVSAQAQGRILFHPTMG